MIRVIEIIVPVVLVVVVVDSGRVSPDFRENEITDGNNGHRNFMFPVAIASSLV